MRETLWLDQTGSTNSWLKENAESVSPMTLVAAVSQTSGRGQRGNSWESEPGKNLTFSFYFNPEGILPSEQFVVSEAVSLAMVAVLERYGINALVKWPNDIYVGQRKIAGILIENSIMGQTISRCIAGIGLNVNQDEFHSDAPNPVSMKMLTGKNYNLEELLSAVGEEMEKKIAQLGDRDSLHNEYLGRLWRSRGEYRFRDAATGEIFIAGIENIERSGHLVLTVSSTREKRRYAFKEVAFLV